MPVSVRDETPADHAAVREINRLAFGQDDEARLVEALRESGDARIAVVAEDAGQLVGHLLFSRMTIAAAAGTIEALALAPLAVRPDRQRVGIGSALVQAGLQACAGRGHRIVIVLGHPEFYSRFGFSATLAERLQAPFSGPEFMALELVPGALDGVDGQVCYPAAFGIVS